MNEGILGSTAVRRGHFVLESGHHGALWLDLELLCLHPAEIDPPAAALAERLRPVRPEVVCGPLNEGAFVALRVASLLGVEFAYAERFDGSREGVLFPVEYRVPGLLRAFLAGRRVAIVNDVINAGSAVRGTHADLIACGAVPIALATLLVLGDSAARFAEQAVIPLLSLYRIPNEIWSPDACPLCASGVPLDRT
jgi:orotate phosphoribosyltransferase